MSREFDGTVDALNGWKNFTHRPVEAQRLRRMTSGQSCQYNGRGAPQDLRVQEHGTMGETTVIVGNSPNVSSSSGCEA